MVINLNVQYNGGFPPDFLLLTQAPISRKIRTHLDLLSIPQSGGENVKTSRRDHGLQIQNLFILLYMVRWHYHILFLRF